MDFLRNHSDEEFSKEELINRFAKTFSDENEIDAFLSEIEVDYTFRPSNMYVTCKSGTVYFKWLKQ